MPHGPIFTNGEFYRNFIAYYDGFPYVTGSNIGRCIRVSRPASVNNLKVLGYRSPAPWSAQNYRWDCSEGVFEIRNRFSGVTLSTRGQIGGFGVAEADSLATFDPNLADSVFKEMFAKMLDQDVAFNAFALQGKQALGMVANLATGVANGTDNLMTTEWGRPKAFRNFLAKAGNSAIRNFSGKYLEFLYGWKPLADDVQNAFSRMIEGSTGPQQLRFRVRVSRTARRSDTLTVTYPASTYWTSNRNWVQDLERKRYVKAVAHYEFPEQVSEMLPTVTPFGTLWELTPWSFVVDWFIPIGAWVGAMEATQYSVFMRDAVLTQSVRVASKTGSKSRWEEMYPSFDWVQSYLPSPTLSGQSFKMTREVLSRWDVLAKTHSLPSFSSKFGLPQASQALALFQQVLNKWFR